MQQAFIISIVSILVSIGQSSNSQSLTENVILITLDGLRWEELFGGGVDSLMNDENYVADMDTSALQLLFGGATREERRKKLMPWMWSKLVSDGQLYGNRLYENVVQCTNGQYFSYPGYNEILSGYGDPNITSNNKDYNKNITVLEWINNLPKFSGKVAAFASWDVFPFIINDQRSGLPVNAGFRKAEDEILTYKEQVLNTLQDEIPSPWGSVRLDAFTHHYMMEYLKKHHPRLVYIAYGETDDFAHDGEYDHYLLSANQTDQWISDLWDHLQSDIFYKNKTTLLITTDHGRGNSPKWKWKGHGSDYNGSEYIWIAALGPDTPAYGEIKTKGLLFQNQIAKTVSKLLGLDFNNKRNTIGKEISTIFKTK